jgi:hypothetical protein
MAGGGNLLIDALVTLACFAGGGSFLILIDQYRKEAKDNGAWGVFGDFPNVPEGMRTGSRERLGGAKHDGPRLGVEHDIAHRDEGYTS